jgi:hypothetical protein
MNATIQYVLSGSLVYRKKKHIGLLTPLKSQNQTAKLVLIAPSSSV